MKKFTQPWLHSPAVDGAFILLPAIFPLLIILLAPDYFKTQTEVTSFWWIILVLAIDVGHVYSTIFRFYWSPSSLVKFRSHLVLIPVFGFVIGALLYTSSPIAFWRVLAYLAVFHFVRQQYGFMRLYSREENQSKIGRWIDNAAIYSATLYPLIYWHIYLINEINWFIKDDFITLPQFLAPYFTVLFYGILALYLIKLVLGPLTGKGFNIPKNALILGTYLSWYAGIIYFRGDLVFTMMNVVAHGIPYIALVYIHENKNPQQAAGVPWRKLAVFLGTIFILAYFEEGIWDILVWKEHEEVFPLFTSMPQVNSQVLLALIVPLLTLPQLTHYVLDGFIWKRSGGFSAVR